MSKRVGDWMQTASGGKIWPLDPRPEEVSVLDIAHGLSNICRFAGHVREFYSVAQHCVLVARQCPPEHRLWGLLHDAPEAYLGDLIRPLKRSLLDAGVTVYRDAEDRLMKVICMRYGMPFEQPACVKDADLVLLQTERRDLLSFVEWEHDYVPDGLSLLPDPIVPVGPKEAEEMFLEAFRSYR